VCLWTLLLVKWMVRHWAGAIVCPLLLRMGRNQW
jgi:hypothetical protein